MFIISNYAKNIKLEKKAQEYIIKKLEKIFGLVFYFVEATLDKKYNIDLVFRSKKNNKLITVGCRVRSVKWYNKYKSEITFRLFICKIYCKECKKISNFRKLDINEKCPNCGNYLEIIKIYKITEYHKIKNGIYPDYFFYCFFDEIKNNIIDFTIIKMENFYKYVMKNPNDCVNGIDDHDNNDEETGFIPFNKNKLKKSNIFGIIYKEWNEQQLEVDKRSLVKMLKGNFN